MPMSGKVLPVSRAQAKVQALAQDFSDDPQFNQVVQLGEHSTGKAFQQYVPEQSVMGKDYENTPFKVTLDSAVINNPSRYETRARQRQLVQHQRALISST